MRVDEERESFDTSVPEATREETAQALETAHRELLALLEDRADVMKKIGAVKRTITGLVCLFGEGILSEDLREVVKPRTTGPQSGLTSACRTVLMEHGGALNAWEVCQRLQRSRPSLLQGHKSAIASVTTVLNRLIKYGEALPGRDKSGRRTWLWAAESVPQPSHKGPILGVEPVTSSQDQ